MVLEFHSCSLTIHLCEVKCNIEGLIYAVDRELTLEIIPWIKNAVSVRLEMYAVIVIVRKIIFKQQQQLKHFLNLSVREGRNKDENRNLFVALCSCITESQCHDRNRKYWEFQAGENGNLL